MKAKLNLTLVLILMFYMNSFAQSNKNNKITFYMGIELGVSKTNLIGELSAFPNSEYDFSLFDQNSLTKGLIGPILNCTINEKYALETGILYEKKGTKLDAYTLHVTENTITRKGFPIYLEYEYLQIPVMGKFKIGKNKFKGSIQAGPYFSFLHSAAIREVHITLSNPLNSGLKEDNRRNTQSIDIGWKIAIGGELNNSDKTTTYTHYEVVWACTEVPSTVRKLSVSRLLTSVL